jgi:hypothetical protein
MDGTKRVEMNMKNFFVFLTITVLFWAEPFYAQQLVNGSRYFVPGTSVAFGRFVGIALDEYTPDHSTISRTRRLIDLDTHREVFAWVLGVLADRGLLTGQRIAIDATTLEANAAMRSIVRRDTGESWSSAASRTATRRAGCGAAICAEGKTF